MSNGLMVYILEFLYQGHAHKVLIRPIDAANGVILDSVGDSDLMKGQLLNGGEFEISFPQILKVERYKVNYRAGTYGNTSKVREVSESEVEKIIEKNTNPETGEVEGISSIEQKGNSENKVERKSKGWLW